MWKFTGLTGTLRPDQEPLNRRLYVVAKKLVRALIKTGLFLVSPVLGAILLKLVWAVASLLFIYVLSWWMPTSVGLDKFWDIISRSITWVISERPSFWWVVGGAALTWWPFIRSR